MKFLYPLPGRALTPESLREALTICEDPALSEGDAVVVRALLLRWAQLGDFLELLRYLVLYCESSTKPSEPQLLLVRFLREAISVADGMPRPHTRDSVYGAVASARVQHDWQQRAQDLLREFCERFDGSEYDVANARGRFLCELMRHALGAMCIYPIRDHLRALKRRRAAGDPSTPTSPVAAVVKTPSPPPKEAAASWANRPVTKRVRANLDLSSPTKPAATATEGDSVA